MYWGFVWALCIFGLYAYAPQYLSLKNAVFLAAFLFSIACFMYLYDAFKRLNDKRLLKLKVRQNRRNIASREARFRQDVEQERNRLLAKRNRLQGLMGGNRAMTFNKNANVNAFWNSLSELDRAIMRHGAMPWYGSRDQLGRLHEGSSVDFETVEEADLAFKKQEQKARDFGIWELLNEAKNSRGASDLLTVKFERSKERRAELQKLLKIAEDKDAEALRSFNRASNRGFVTESKLKTDGVSFFDGIFSHFERLSYNGRVKLYEQYLQYLDPENGSDELGLVYDQLSIEGKVCMIPRLIVARGIEKECSAVRFEKSQHDAGIYCYFASSGFINIAAWRDALPTICKYLGGKYTIREDDGTKIYLIRHRLPDVIPMTDAHLRKGSLCVGYEFETSKPHWIDLERMTHMLVVGISGMGKSVFLNQLLQGILFNIDSVDRCFLVDLKGGVELYPYQERSSKISVVYRYEQLSAVVSELVELIYSRLESMRVNGVRSWAGGYVFFIVDEYAQVQLFRSQIKAEKDEHSKLLANLNIVSMLGRAAGVRIVAQLQKATTDVMDSSFRTNLQSQVCFRVRDNLTASAVFGSSEDLPATPMRLQQGEFVMYDDTTGETFHGKSCMVTESLQSGS